MAFNEAMARLEAVYERIEAKCDELERRIEEDEDFFCDRGYGESRKCCEGCPLIKDNGDIFSYEGQYSCPAEFDPADGDCFFNHEYELYVKEREEAEAFIKQAYEKTLPCIEQVLGDIEVLKEE